jgi:uncharacterized protein YutE (UPF0331/DUF86 family)
MTPPPVDRGVIGSRLRLIRNTLGDLGALADVTADELTTDAIERAAAERFIQVIVDLAIDVNGHVLVAETGAAPGSGRESFILMATAVGAITADLGEELAPSAGMRNLLVHRYGDIDVALVAAAIARTLSGFERYVAEVSRWLESRPAD